VAAKIPGGLGNAQAKPKSPGVLKCSEAAEERSGWNCWRRIAYDSLIMVSFEHSNVLIK
jgi:hypothetical protein